jgi:uncharacterized Zn finger protein
MASKTTPLPPEIVETRCTACRDTTEHQVLKGKVVRGGLGVEGTFECLECKTVHTGLVSFPAPLDIPFIVSQDAESEPASVPLFEDDVVAVGDEFEIEDSLIEVTAIELKEEARRVNRAKAQEIKTLWGKNIDIIRIGFALNIGDITRSFEAEFGPEDEIAIGDEFEYEDGDVIVDKILTFDGKRFRGSHNVREIKRVWLRRKGEPKKERRDPTVPRGQKEQRRAGRQQDKAPRTASGRTSGDRPSGGRPSSSDRPSGGRPSGGRPSGGRPSGGRPSGGRPSGGRPSGGRPSGGRPSGGRPSGGRPSGGRPSGGRPSGGRPSGGRPSGGPGGGRGGPRGGGGRGRGGGRPGPGRRP